MKSKIYLICFIILMLLIFQKVFSEVIEEIVVKINDDIITKSEFEQSERALTTEIYSSFTGEELDNKLKEAKDYILYNLINEKLLLQKAEQSYDMEKLGSSLLKEFREQRNLKTTKDFEEFLETVRMTAEQVKQEILKFQAPQMVLNSLVRDKINVSNKEIGDYYQENIADFTTPEKRTIKEIVLMASSDDKEEVMKKGEEILERLKQGEDFSELARQFSEAATKGNDGLLGTFIKGELSSELDTIAFAMKEGEISDLIETSYGYHLIKVEKIELEKVTPLEEVKFKISDRISDDKYSQAVKELLTRMWSESSIEVNEKYQQRLNIKH